MLGALFSLSAGGVVFTVLVIILIIGSMLYQSIQNRISPGGNIEDDTDSLYFCLGSHQLSTFKKYPQDCVILFLDFDGVMHRCQNESFERMPLLEEILAKCPKMLIVISSSWRETMAIEGLRLLFSTLYRERIIGVTPSIKNTSGKSYIRHEECLFFAEEAGINRFIIVDDELQKFPPCCEELISTEYRIGLTEKTVENIVLRYQYLIE